MLNLPRYCFVIFFVFLFTFLVNGFNQVYASEPAGNASVVVSWQGVDGAFSYNLYFKERGETFYTHAAANLPTAARNFTIEYLKVGVPYVYKVGAVNAEGKEFWFSAEKSFWSGVSAVVSSPLISANLTGGIAGKASAIASWQSQPKADYYNIYYKEVGESSYSHAVARVPREAVSLTISFLKNGIGYRYNVAAFYDGVEHWLGEKTLVWPVEKVRGRSPAISPVGPKLPEGMDTIPSLPLLTPTPAADLYVPTITPPITIPTTPQVEKFSP